VNLAGSISTLNPVTTRLPSSVTQRLKDSLVIILPPYTSQRQLRNKCPEPTQLLIIAHFRKEFSHGHQYKNHCKSAHQQACLVNYPDGELAM
jgi:hypothetical protein